MASMFEREEAGFTEAFDPNAEPGVVPEEPVAETPAEAAQAEVEAPQAEAEAPQAEAEGEGEEA